MKLGIVADEINRDFSAAVKVGQSIGLRAYEVRNLTTGRAPACDAAELLEVERIRDGEGIEITALSPGLFKWTQDEAGFRREMSELFPRAVELAHRWNLAALVVFGFHKPGATEEQFYRGTEVPAQVAEWFTEAAERAAESRLQLWIEPEPICWMDTAAAAAELIERTGSDALRINYDPGNVAWLLGRDPRDELERAAPYIANVHVKDLQDARMNDGKPLWVVPGEGIIDYGSHFAALQRIGFTGRVSLEPHMDGSKETTERCKIAVEQLWGTASEK